MIIDFVAIASFTVLIPLLVGFNVYKRLPLAGRYVAWLLVAWFIAEALSYMLRVNGYSNWNVYFLLSFAELILVTQFFRSILLNRKVKSIITWIAWTGLCIVPAEYAIVNGPDNTVTILFECIFFFSMGLYAFYETAFNKVSSKYNLLVTCMMTFFLASAIYFSTWRFMKYDEHLFRMFGYAHAVLLIGCYGLFTYSLWRLQLS